MSLNKKKILIVSPRFPYPTYKGDQLVVFNFIRCLSLKYDIDLISFYEEEIKNKDYEKVKQYCNTIKIIKLNKFTSYIEIIKNFFTSVPLQVAYFKSKKFQKQLNVMLSSYNYDLLLVFTLRMSQYVEKLSYKKYIHLIDSMYLNMKRRADKEKGIKKIIFKYEACKVRKYEKKLISKYDEIFLVSRVDKKLIDENNKIKILPNGVEILKCTEINKSSNFIITFSGNMGYFPNQDAVIWFVENCWQEIVNFIPNAVFRIVGKNPSKKIQSLEQKYKNIEVTGFVNSVLKELCKSDVVIAPMRAGSGMQNKILEAMSVKKPVITTSIGLGDIKAEVGKEILLANTSEEFIKQILYLLDKKNRKYIGYNGYNYVVKNHSWKNIILSEIKV